MRKEFWTFVQICILLFVYSFNARVDAVDCNVDPKNAEGRLRKTLFCNYDKDNRPTTTNGPIIVKFKMIIKGFMFDDSNGKLTVSTWLAMSWTDEHLKWEPKDFNNLASITQSSDSIWSPDLALYNSDVESASRNFCKDANCVISSSGVVSCIPPCSHTAKCSPNYDRWPFDKQNCTLHIGTWVNSGDEIDFKVMKIIITDDELSSQNLEWKMIRASYKRNPGNFSDTRQTYPSLTFSFAMKRHSAVHAAIILIPAITLVSLNLISLWVDSENNRRIILLSLSLYGHFIYMQQLYWALPHNGDTIPDIVIYFRDSLLITVVLIVNSIIVQGLSSCSLGIPNWIENTTNYMNSNRYGSFFLTKHLIQRERFGDSQDGATEDDINLVESQANEKRAENDKPKIWRTFGNIVDRLLFVALGITYMIMLISLIPEKIFDQQDVSSVEIVGL